MIDLYSCGGADMLHVVCGHVLVLTLMVDGRECVLSCAVKDNASIPSQQACWACHQHAHVLQGLVGINQGVFITQGWAGVCVYVCMCFKHQVYIIEPHTKHTCCCGQGC